MGASPGDHTVTVRVADQGGLEDFETITITVNDVNLTPVLAASGRPALVRGAVAWLCGRRPRWSTGKSWGGLFGTRSRGVRLDCDRCVWQDHPARQRAPLRE